jgi:hypothetical protein
LSKHNVKIEFNDNDGSKYTIALDGPISKEKVLRIMDIMNIMHEKTETTDTHMISRDTSFGRTYQLIEKRFSLGSFTSTDLLEAYEDEYNNPVRLSTISTYLSRLEQRNLLSRQRTASGWIYRYERTKIIQR